MQETMVTVVIGGLSLSTLLTLVVIPVVHTLVDDGVDWVKRRLIRRAPLTGGGY